MDNKVKDFKNELNEFSIIELDTEEKYVPIFDYDPLFLSSKLAGKNEEESEISYFTNKRKSKALFESKIPPKKSPSASKVTIPNLKKIDEQEKELAVSE